MARRWKPPPFSPDGQIVVSTGWDFAARLWDTFGGKVLQQFKHEGRVTAASFRAQRHTIATASYDGTVGLWDAVSGKRLQRLPHDKEVNTAEFSPDGRTIVSASDDNTARLWDVASGKELQRLKHEGKVHAASFSPDGAHHHYRQRGRDGPPVERRQRKGVGLAPAQSCDDERGDAAASIVRSSPRQGCLRSTTIRPC